MCSSHKPDVTWREVSLYLTNGHVWSVLHVLWLLSVTRLTSIRPANCQRMIVLSRRGKPQPVTHANPRRRKGLMFCDRNRDLEQIKVSFHFCFSWSILIWLEYNLPKFLNCISSVTKCLLIWPELRKSRIISIRIHSSVSEMILLSIYYWLTCNIKNYNINNNNFHFLH